MFKHIRTPLSDSINIDTFIDENTGDKLSLIPQLGGLWHELKFNSLSIIDAYKNLTEARENRWAKNVFLYPFANRLNDGAFTFAGNHYQWPINDTTHHHAIHGFGMLLPMDLNVLSLNPLTLELKHCYQGELSYYPFPFEITLSITMFNQSIEVQCLVVNQHHHDIPFNFGFHPYFKLDESIEACELSLPQRQHLKLNDRMVPNHQAQNLEKSRELIEGSHFDDCFKLIESHQVNKVALKSKKHRLQLALFSRGNDGFRYLQIFIPPDRKSIALEPMTTAANDFNNNPPQGMIKKNHHLKQTFKVSMMSLI